MLETPPGFPECRRCSKCCRLFVRTGVQLGNGELLRIREFLAKSADPCVNLEAVPREGIVLPTVPGVPGEQCVFLNADGSCGIYPVRPQKCVDYPIAVKNLAEVLVVYVDLDCPRGQAIATMLTEGSLPIPGGNPLGKRIEVRRIHGFDRKLSEDEQ